MSDAGSAARPATRAGRPGAESRDPRPGLLERLGLPYMDQPLAASAVALAALSVAVLAVATRGDVPGDPYYFAERQGIYLLVGVLGMLGLARFDYSRYRDLRVGIYTLLCAGIALIFIFGFSARGSRRAFELPLFSFQPSELGKLLLVLALAGFAIDGFRRGSPARRTARCLALGLFPASLVFLQPDLGTSLVYAAITLAVIYLAGAPWSHVAALGGVVILSITFALAVAPRTGVPGLHDYQVERLTSFLEPSRDPGDAGYQQNQAMIAIGSGEKTGRGDQATQTRLAFVPERQTDFIFAVIGERWGFMGTALILSLYALLTWRALRIVTLSKNTYGALVAGGIAVAILFQVSVNIGMNLGIMPITGIPLPLLSFGGSSMVATLLGIGVLQSVHMQARLGRGGRQES